MLSACCAIQCKNREGWRGNIIQDGKPPTRRFRRILQIHQRKRNGEGIPQGDLPDPNNLAAVLSFLTFFAELGIGDIVFCIFFSVCFVSCFWPCKISSIEREREKMKSGSQKTQGEPGWVRGRYRSSSAEKMSRGREKEMPIVILPRHAPPSGEILARKTPPGVCRRAR